MRPVPPSSPPTYHPKSVHLRYVDLDYAPLLYAAMQAALAFSRLKLAALGTNLLPQSLTGFVTRPVCLIVASPPARLALLRCTSAHPRDIMINGHTAKWQSYNAERDETSSTLQLSSSSLPPFPLLCRSPRPNAQKRKKQIRETFGTSRH